MSQNPTILPTSGTLTGLGLVQKVNDALDTLASHLSGATDPGTVGAHRLWADTQSGLLKLRNGNNDGWTILGGLSDLGIQSGLQVTATAGGTGDALTASFVPTVATLVNGMSLCVRSNASNTTPNPTFTPNSGIIPAKAIVKGAGQALVAGDIAGPGHWLELVYDQTLDKWLLLNPATGVSSVPTGSVIHVAQTTPPPGYLKANGATVSRTTYAALFATIGTVFGPGDGATTFHLPDLRGEFLRGWDDGRGVDVGRALGAAQVGTRFPSLYVYSTSSTAGQLVSHPISSNSAYPNDAYAQSTDSQVTHTSGVYMSTALTPQGSSSIVAFTARPRNVALLACIKF